MRTTLPFHNSCCVFHGFRFAEYEGDLCMIGVDYVFYSRHALKSRNQDDENAPLVVERVQVKISCALYDCLISGGQHVETEDQKVTRNTEVWRYSYTTYNRTLYRTNALLFPRVV